MPDTLDDIEARAVEATSGKWTRDVEKLRAAILALWSAKGGSLTAAEVTALVRKLDARPAQVEAAKLLVPAAVLGDGRVTTKTAVHTSKAAAKVLAGIRAKPADAVAEALKRAKVVPLDSLSGVLAVVGPLSKSAADMRGAASYAVHLSANEATVSAAAQVEAKVVFVPERDACLECTEMAGATGDDIELPPLHPHCRCEVQPYDDEDVPKALKREAVRSVLRGFSLPSESEAARLRAAKALLKKGPVAPQSVKDYAAAAIKKGKFPRGKNLP